MVVLNYVIIFELFMLEFLLCIHTSTEWMHLMGEEAEGDACASSSHS